MIWCNKNCIPSDNFWNLLIYKKVTRAQWNDANWVAQPPLCHKMGGLATTEILIGYISHHLPYIFTIKLKCALYLQMLKLRFIMKFFFYVLFLLD